METTSDGNVDFIYDLCERVESMRWSCKNCTQVRRHYYESGDFYCTGVVKRPSIYRPFDLIHECDKSFDSGDFINQLDQTPDEALNKSNVLVSAVSYWMENNNKYKKFRKYTHDNNTH